MKALLGVAIVSLSVNAQAQSEDPYQWLEDVTGDKAMAWVKAQNAETQPMLEAHPGFKALNERLVSIIASRDRIPYGQKRGEWVYNFWQDAQFPRGVWRRTTMAEYRKKDPAWETVLDIGKLSADEKETWVYKGSSCLFPEYKRCIVSLSRGGADAVELREFDMETKQFVAGGFRAPESKSSFAWRDADTLYVARDFGPGTMTTSGYPRQVREWKRGTPMEQARLVYESQAGDVGAWPTVVHEKGRTYERYRRTISTRTGEEYIRRGDKWVRIEVPEDANVATFNGLLVVQLRSDWKPGATTFKAGSLISTDLDNFLDGGRDFQAIFTPAHRVSLQSYAATRNYLLLDILDNVKGRVVEARLDGGRWKMRDVPTPKAASIGVSAVDRHESDEYWLTVTSFTEPSTLYLGKAGADELQKLKSLPAFFDAKGITVTQYEATSRDGTKVPYFVVMREGTRLDGNNPTILYGYGGFEVAQTPSYSASIGAAWLEKGNVWVLSNLRGGGEFGPEWHQTARREGRQKTHDDFIAVGEDLVKRGITSPRHLGIYGGSQGGLLVGAAFTQRPELFRAAVATVPLMDMQRYHKLLAGASWIGEYGNPDEPKDWEFISKYSPYQNVAKGKKYPRVFLVTTTRDDRVHPGHARKMFAKMKEQGHDVLYFENTEGGHGSGTTPEQQAYFYSLIYTFFARELS